MKHNKKLFILFLIFTCMINNAQKVFIQGGGTLEDWAHLSKFEEKNKELKNAYKFVPSFVNDK